jgi:hypothetical protein
VKFNVRDLHIMLLSIYEFCESRFGESHVSLKGFKFVRIFYTPHAIWIKFYKDHIHQNVLDI